MALSSERSNALAASTETRQDAFSCKTSCWKDVPDSVVTDITTVRNKSLFLSWLHHLRPVLCCIVATGHVWSCVFTLTSYQKLLNNKWQVKIFLACLVFLLCSSGYSCPQWNITGLAPYIAIYETSNIFLLVIIVWLYTAFIYFFQWTDKFISESHKKKKKINKLHAMYMFWVIQS